MRLHHAPEKGVMHEHFTAVSDACGAIVTAPMEVVSHTAVSVNLAQTCAQCVSAASTMCA